MRKYITILITFIIILMILCLIKQLNKENSQSEKKLQIEYNEYSFYKPKYLNRYNNYKIKFPNLTIKDIILRVNIGLDRPFYTETNEIKEFNKLMIVNKYNYVSKDFIPNNLVLVTEYSKENMYLNEECKNAFIQMAHDAKVSGYNIRAVSTYRTFDYQDNLYKNYVKQDGVLKADTYSARPGYSEHHTGLAIDIDNTILNYNNFENTKEFNWMINNSFKYGFILRYPKNTTITGYIYEPWHYRYVGTSVASYIHEKNITFEEYYYEFLDK